MNTAIIGTLSYLTSNFYVQTVICALSRKFANALDMLVTSLDANSNIDSSNDYNQQLIKKNSQSSTTTSTTTITTTTKSNFVDLHLINGFGSLVMVSDDETIKLDMPCDIDHDCGYSNGLYCQMKRCKCKSRTFWSHKNHTCISCRDLSIGNRCFRFSSNKATWYDSNEYCKDEIETDDNDDLKSGYSLKLASNLNITDIELLRYSLNEHVDDSVLDYYYWIGATSHIDTIKLHNSTTIRKKRRVPRIDEIAVYEWYDNGEHAQLESIDIWCPKGSEQIKKDDQCVSITGCGLYADDCNRNYRFLCEAY
ncbi:unnamed protein product [Didymodactylos carnosus]|uniref:C-type lectin domain-containing protein n=1 Tax=Didymodactylos carnosus TaxID=1234261 RepID=A0A815V9B0_9BILA|nr:unnamed protein product [Didymodactylos carnosus]CAF1527517.1 unnamed protein product [Didymodactylos carnosus]CAF3756488.1 unnamed protein product [Didymodactylos carnosus]CAF4386635.1 unnamed protein product [Didymodactylos carnosus]